VGTIEVPRIIDMVILDLVECSKLGWTGY